MQKNIGIDIGGTKIRIGVIDGKAHILAMEKLPMQHIPAGQIMRCDSDSGKKLIKSMVLRTADRQGMC